MAGELDALIPHPGFQGADKGSAPVLAHRQALGGGQAVDFLLDGEDGVDPLHRLQGDGGDHRVLGAFRLAPCALGDVGQLEQLAPAVAPAQGLEDRARRPRRFIKLVVAAIGVRLQHSRPGGEMGLRVLSTPIARVVEQRRRRRWTAERAVVADVGPYPGDIGLADGQHRHGRVIPMQPLSGQNMGLQASVDRQGGHADRAHLIGQGGQAQRHALSGVALGLPVQRLVLAELLEHDHGQQAWSRPAPGGDVEGRGWLGDGLAVAAAEALAHRGDHLPLARDHLQRLSHVLAELGQPLTAAARTGGRSWDHHALAR